MKDCQAGCKYFSGGEVKHHKDCVHYPESFSKMYDDIYQQNKEKDAEIQRLTKEVEELKESKEKRISELTAVGMGKQQEIDDTKQSIKNLQCRIQELERFSGWKDMEPHHPIGSNLGYGEIGKEPDWEKLSEIEPPTDNHLDNKAWRGAWLEGQMVGYAKGQIELTRLRELLGRAKEYIPFVRINGEPERHTSDCKYPYSKCKCHLEELLTEIDNETDGKDN